MAYQKIPINYDILKNDYGIHHINEPTHIPLLITKNPVTKDKKKIRKFVAVFISSVIVTFILLTIGMLCNPNIYRNRSHASQLQWGPVGPNNMTDNAVELLSFNGLLYGIFQPIGAPRYLARLQNNYWEPLKVYGSSPVTTIAHCGDQLCAGIYSEFNGSVSPIFIMGSDGKRWHGVGTVRVRTFVVNKIVHFQDGYYINLNNDIYHLDTSTWTWKSIDVFPSNHIYSGDDFIYSMGIGQMVQRWDGFSSSNLGSVNKNGEIDAFEVLNDELFVGGHFDTIDGTEANNIAKWNGMLWETLTPEIIDGGIITMKVFNGELYVGGEFSNGIVKWTGSGWHTVQYVSGVVFSMTEHEGKLVIGGLFFSAGGVPIVNIAVLQS